MTNLTWHRVGPQDYCATLPDGTEAKVPGHYVDDRGHDGDHGVLTGWQWGAQIDGNLIDDFWHDRMRDAKDSVRRYLENAGTGKEGSS